MKTKKTTTILGILLLAAVGIVWGFSSSAEDPQLLKVKQLQSELTAKNVEPEQRREKFEQLRNEMEKLPEEKRREAWRGMREGFQARMEERIDKFFELPTDERVAYLDEQIDEMEKMRKEFEKRRAERAKSENESGTEKKQQGRRGSGNWRNMSDQERDQRRKNRLDNTTPERRAKFMEYMSALQQRQKDRGLPQFGFGRGRGR